MTTPHERCAVHKFGGSSLADAAGFRRAGAIIAARSDARRIVVVSAMGGVTNALVESVERAGARRADYRETLDVLRRRHADTIAELLPPETGAPLTDALDHDLADMAHVLHATTLLGRHSRDTLDLVSGYGEVWSARIFAAHLREQLGPVAEIDARGVLVASRGATVAEVDWDCSRARVGAWIRERGGMPSAIVITGFVASTTDGVATTLGRNGSDFSASIFAVLLDADEIHIWTDVDGVMSADPRLVPDAVTLDALSYDEAMELAYFGAKVIHPSTMAPAVERSLPIFIRNTFRPELPGTRIEAHAASAFDIKGLATVEDVALLNLEGTGLIGVPGTAQRLFGALRDDGISVVMISQGSSEHSICFAVPRDVASRASEAVERAFFAELHHGQVHTVGVTEDCSILAVVGDGMAGRPGVAAKFFSALGKAGVNIRAIAQGSSERNISVVVGGADTQRALRAAHSSFYLSHQTLSIGLIGAGNVGATLLGQLAHESARLKRDFDVDLRVRAIATSARMVLTERPAELADWRTVMAANGEPLDLDRLASHVHAEHLPHAVLVDCTASEDVASRYGDWLERGIHVITPNKRANTAPLDYYRRLRGANRAIGAHYLYETTVGAALPIVQTLRDLVQTGDEVHEVEGILSGTLSYLFNRFDGAQTFSSLVIEARDLGYTEPDPRDDLSGTDVARKIVILAREIGMPMELAHVDVKSLVPEALKGGSVASFLAALPRHDAEMENVRATADAAGKVLRFVGRVGRDGEASVGLRAYPRSHPFARIQLTDNVVLFRTSRYRENPLVVQGPGAGREVTAAGVFADLLRLAAYLGAPL
ncbi:MAG TPA: bifunctional aspartate kinase/homoserine dehydrogenase I [Gemmatimonadaceae bacterium]|jgi:aspartokinase/homoserine dehydrogenase 1|nr:bifunctional aspartate kinase/homoserine dehydrogenase I [Gemmatimonadaceae bacterium]